jgi:hypothetical protein
MVFGPGRTLELNFSIFAHTLHLHFHFLTSTYIIPMIPGHESMP